MIRSRIVLGSTLLLVLALPPATANADTLTFPGCGATLQACIDGAMPGDVIEIATNDPIDESVTIEKSLTLRAAPGFSPVIGASATTRTLSVDDVAAAPPVSVVVRGIEFSNAFVDVGFYHVPGNSFVLRSSRIEHEQASNNARGIDVDVRQPASVLVADSFFRTTGQQINFFAMLPAGEATLTAVGNELTTSDPADSYHAITIDLRGSGIVTANAFSNVMYSVYGCNCGGPGAIYAATSESVRAVVNLVGNTIDDTESGGPGIYIQEPSGTSRLRANVFDNLITRSTGPPLSFPESSAAVVIRNGYNNFFANADPPEFGGYPAGPSTLEVNPRYRNPAARNYRLEATSPLRDAGLNCTPGGLSRTDAGRRFRIAGGRVDIGAYEIGGGARRPGRNLFGTAGPDALTGGSGSDLLCGFGGGDTLRGSGGGDFVEGGADDDGVRGGRGQDRLVGNAGADELFGGADNDRVLTRDGVSGNDTAAGGPGRDRCLIDRGDASRGCE